MYDILIPYPTLGGVSSLLKSSPLPPISKPLITATLFHFSVQPCYVISCLYGHITWQSMSGMKAVPLGNTVHLWAWQHRVIWSLNNKMAQKKKTKMKYKKWLIHIIFMLPYLLDSAAVFSSSFNSGASANKSKVRTVLATYEWCTVFQLIISIMVLTELAQHGPHALWGLFWHPDGIILTICSSQGFQYTHIDQFNEGLIWCFPTKTEMAQYMNLCLPSAFL